MNKPAALPPARVVTVSATYGASGSVIAPRLAAALGLGFADRAVSSSAAVAAMENPSAEERAAAPPSRWLTSLAKLASVVPGVPTPDTSVSEPANDMRAEGERQVAAAVASGPVLILGRAAALVLADHPSAFHIRLDGPPEARIARACEIEHIDVGESRRRCEAADRLRSTFVRRLYNRDPADASIYHIVLDSTAFATDDCVALLAAAADAFWSTAEE
jgi:cytidylate kinase